MKRNEHANTPAAGKSIAGPCHPKVKTQLTLNDLGKEKIHKATKSPKPSSNRTW